MRNAARRVVFMLVGAPRKDMDVVAALAQCVGSVDSYGSALTLFATVIFGLVLLGGVGMASCGRGGHCAGRYHEHEDEQEDEPKPTEALPVAGGVG